LIKWVFENTTCRKLISWAPEGNQRAYDFAIKAGLVDEGVCKKSFIKNGVLLDQHLMGIGKE
jgi:RimJ/RimL family protein N-acetyltransferase